MTRGSTAAADAITTRAPCRCAIEYKALARTDVTPMCGSSPRYGSTSCERKRQDRALDDGRREPLERREEERDIAAGFLEIAVARHDIQHHARRLRVGRRRARTRPSPTA